MFTHSYHAHSTTVNQGVIITRRITRHITTLRGAGSGGGWGGDLEPDAERRVDHALEVEAASG